MKKLFALSIVVCLAFGMNCLADVDKEALATIEKLEKKALELKKQYEEVVAEVNKQKEKAGIPTAPKKKELTATNGKFKKVEKLLDRIKYSWKAEVHNPFNEDVECYVRFSLLDEEGFEVGNAMGKVKIPADSTKTVTGTGMAKEDVYKTAVSGSIKID